MPIDRRTLAQIDRIIRIVTTRLGVDVDLWLAEANAWRRRAARCERSANDRPRFGLRETRANGLDWRGRG